MQQIIPRRKEFPKQNHNQRDVKQQNDSVGFYWLYGDTHILVSTLAACVLCKLKFRTGKLVKMTVLFC